MRWFKYFDGYNVLDVTEDSIGVTHYYLNGVHHRADGPAVIYPSGLIKYYKHGDCHRENGPAVIFPDGDKRFYLNGQQINYIGNLYQKDNSIEFERAFILKAYW